MNKEPPEPNAGPESVDCPAQALRRALCNHPALGAGSGPPGRAWDESGLRIDWIEKTGSTNADLLNAPFGPAPAGPRVLVSRTQSGGRGRLGRPWTTIPGASLALSVALERGLPGVPGAGSAGRGPAPALSAWQGLSIAVGAVLADQLVGSGDAPPSLRLKWPNDLWIAGRKVGGILIEVRRQAGNPVGASAATIERVVIGVGLNLFQHPALAGLDVAAGALCDGPVPEPLADPVDIAARVVAAILDASLRLQTTGLSQELLGAWRARDALAGQAVLIRDPLGSGWSGVAAGIDDSGALQVRVGDTSRTVIAGDVSVRPHPGPQAVLTYGSLMFERVWGAVVKGRYVGRAVSVEGWQRFSVPGEDYPGAIPSPGARLEGVLWEGVSADDLVRLDVFEGPQYERIPMVVGPESTPAWIYAWRGDCPLAPTPWEPEAFGQPDVIERFLARNLSQRPDSLKERGG